MTRTPTPSRQAGPDARAEPGVTAPDSAAAMSQADARAMRRRLTALALLLALVAGLWLFAGLPDTRVGFVLHLRAVRLAGMVVVAAAIGMATVLFQTVAQNRVLTPSIMGFDSLFVLVQSLLVATLGTSGFADIGSPARFALGVASMMALAALLFLPLLRGGLSGGRSDLGRMILTGIILGVLFRSLAGFLARVMDPNAFAVVQGVSVASFARIDPVILPWAAAIVALASAAALAMARPLDVLALGRPVAVSLGLRVGALTTGALMAVAVLVSAATALAGPVGVGPVAFFGLIVAGLTHALCPTPRHRQLLPAAGLIAALIVVAGQMLFERVLAQAGTLVVVIDFSGGLFFLFLLLRGRIR